MHGNPVAPDNQKRKQNEDRQRTDKAEFFTYNRKNVVVMLLRQIQVLLSALSEAQAEQTAGADCIFRLENLKTVVQRIRLRITPCGNTVAGIAAAEQQEQKRRRSQRCNNAEKFPVCSADCHHAEAQRRNHDRGGKMRLYD